ncbi:MAG: hypothetical protein II942_00360 [Alphaproteobacteria bacterium]|nr:hypothetical protein [Alphaproteobacteria bacterium]
MREPIFKAVAMPPRMFLAPFKIAAANLVLHGAFMMIGIAAFDLNPLTPLLSAVGCHFLLIFAGMKEPHLSNVLQSWGVSGPASTHNIYKSKGVKMAP